MLARLILHAVGAGLSAGFYGVAAADKAICLLPPTKRVRDLALDSVLGPAEDIKYVSTTAPSSPPPTY